MTYPGDSDRWPGLWNAHRAFLDEQRRQILDSDRIEQGIQGGKERMAERDRIHYGRTTKEMPNGGWDRSIGTAR